MKPIRYVLPGLCSLALISGPMLDALAAGAPDESWQIVPDETLRDLRGGLDLGPLIGSFAIQRIVEVDGQVVARMQIVISNLNRLGQGGMPNIAISGPLAELVQVFNPAGVSASAWAPTSSSSTVNTSPASSVAPASQPANSAATPATASTNTPTPQSTPAGSSPGSAATVATNNGPHIGSTSGNLGTTSATGTQTGSAAQFGAAISQAVAAANGTPSANAAPARTPSAAPASAAQTSAVLLAPATAAASMAVPASASHTPTAPLAATTASASHIPAVPLASTASAANPAQSSTQTFQVGNTGAVIVVSNIPNAAAITSEVQNSVQATRVQTLTTITATLNSLQLLSAAAIANAVRQQIASGH
jgi:hypothetical protein